MKAVQDFHEDPGQGRLSMTQTQESTIRAPLRVAATALLIGTVVVLSQIEDFQTFRSVADAGSYISMAEGHSEGVFLHHAERVLYPWVVGQVASLVGVDGAFLAVATASLIAFLSLLLHVLVHHARQGVAFSAGFIGLPCVFLVYREMYLPTLFFMALSALYWVLLLRRKRIVSVLVLALLILTRQEGVIVAIITVAVVLWRRSRETETRERRALAVFAAGILAASFVAGLIIKGSTPGNTNLHHVSGVVFAVLRIPLFAMRNLLGVMHWVDTYRAIDWYTHEPILSWAAPAWMQHMSSIREIGIYEWSPLSIMETAIYLLTSFGVAPVILWFFLRRRHVRIGERSVAEQTLCLAGLALYLLSPVMGPPGLRYYTSGWPAFLMFVPLLMAGSPGDFGSKRLPLLLLHLACGWLAVVPLLGVGYRAYPLVIVAAIGLHVATWRSLSKA